MDEPGGISSSTQSLSTADNPATGFRFRFGSGQVDSGAVAANTWYFVAAWHDSVKNTLNIQVNNGPVKSVSYTGGGLDTIHPVNLGRSTDGYWVFDGRLDEVAIYKRLLTPAERAWLYNNGDGRSYADLSLPPSTPPNLITYTYGDSAHKHAVTALSTGETYTYDANGNMTQRVEGGVTYTQVFDIENRLASVTVSGQTTQFIYDGDGNLVKKINPDGSKTIYVGGIYEVDKTSGGSTIRTVTYYPVAGAMRIDSTLYYVLKDHLGSASVVTDSSGNVVGENRYYPFGETRLSTGTMVTDKLFTGQQEMASLGIYNYRARFYSPKLGRFLSTDTIVPGMANPQNLNRYAYVNNSPINYTDPTGHERIQEGEQQDKYKPSVYNQYVPKPSKPKKKDNGGGGGGDSLSDNSGGSGGGGGCNLSTLTNANGQYCHQNTYTPSRICFDFFECTPEEQWDYASRFQYPGQAPWNPVVGSDDRSVMGGDFFPGSDLYRLGAVYVRIKGLTMTNFTYPTHIFHEGNITRTISEGYVTTQGQGTNRNILIAAANQYVGPVAFELVDAGMLAFSTADQLSGGRLLQLMNAKP